MGHKYSLWNAKTSARPVNLDDVIQVIRSNREFTEVEQLDYGDHGLEEAYREIVDAIRCNKRIALYADYDVDGTMSCVSWIWFLRGIGYENFEYYIPDRFKEGYGLNLKAVQYLVNDRGAEVVITMDTGITANEEARWCKENGVSFICTDHHKIQEDKMPDCIILNPKMHPEPIYQELCGCGITFVLLRKIATEFPIPHELWTDLLALTGMATICDVVPLNGVNHKLARQGVSALTRSKRPVLQELLGAASVADNMDEQDVGFRLGPRINAVGRLEHAKLVVNAFVDGNPAELVEYMGLCNEKRKKIQASIVDEAREFAFEFRDDPILFLGGDWHPGVVGIAASKIAEEYWRPVWLFEKKDGMCKGSARSVPGFDVTDAMASVGELFTKFGGHKAAGGFSFPEEKLNEIRAGLKDYCLNFKEENPDVWQSKVDYDMLLNHSLLNLSLLDRLDELKPFGNSFEEPSFLIEASVSEVQYFKDKVTGAPKHTAIHTRMETGEIQKILFFNEVHELNPDSSYRFIVTVSRNYFRGKYSVSLFGKDFEILAN